MPFAGVSSVDFIELVVKQDIRPERPYEENAPDLTDEIWKLAEYLWAKDVTKRPTSNIICERLSRLLATTVPRMPPRLTPPAHVAPDPPSMKDLSARSHGDDGQPELQSTQTPLVSRHVIPEALKIEQKGVSELEGPSIDEARHLLTPTATFI